MLGHLYRCALRLHPHTFRERFGGEMLSIFDHTSGTFSRCRLLSDSMLSLMRQWTMRPEFWNEVPIGSQRRVAIDGLPSFAMLDPFRPRAAAVIHGLILTAILFSLTCFAIRYSAIHVLHIHIPTIEFDNSQVIHPSAGPSEVLGPSASALPDNATQRASAQVGTLPTHLYVEPIPVEPDQTTQPTVPGFPLKTASNLPGVPARVATVVEIRLDLYRGDYVSESPHLTISIGISKGHLVMKLDGQPQRTLTPISETTFLVDGTPGSQIEFARATGGKCRRLLLSEPGRQIIAQRP
jgi:hypothetical protein